MRKLTLVPRVLRVLGFTRRGRGGLRAELSVVGHGGAGTSASRRVFAASLAMALGLAFSFAALAQEAMPNGQEHDTTGIEPPMDQEENQEITDFDHLLNDVPMISDVPAQGDSWMWEQLSPDHPCHWDPPPPHCTYE